MYVAVRRVHLNKMPFDKWVNGQRNVHATGDSCLLIDTTDGHEFGWWNEYEDEPFTDAPDCVEEWEDNEED